MRAYHLVSGLVFALFAAVHAFRAIRGVPIMISAHELPVMASWVIVLVAGALAVWAFKSAPRT